MTADNQTGAGKAKSDCITIASNSIVIALQIVSAHAPLLVIRSPFSSFSKASFTDVN